jgi:CelD/BcsL family acetyltransferase involved in cellulose biosynthesis
MTIADRVEAAPPTATVAAPPVVRRPLSDALGMGAAAWDALASLPPMSSPFTSWAWYDAWLGSATPEERARATVLTLHDGKDQPTAMFPFALCRVPFRRATAKALTWATGQDGTPDHLDVVGHPDAAVEKLAGPMEEMEWDVIVLSDVAACAPGVDRLVATFAHKGFVISRRPMHTCPYLDLPRDWDSYLASLSASRRQTIRRKERKLEREYGATFTDYTSETLETGWQRFLMLHKRRWNGPGGFREPRSERLVRRFLERLAASGSLWLTTLDVHGEPAAAWCGFTWKDTVYFYQSGREPQWEAQSVGLVLMSRMIRRAIEGGYRSFDFMKGDESYKWTWTSTSRQTYEVLVFRPGFRGTCLRGLDMARRVRQRLRRALASAQPAAPHASRDDPAVLASSEPEPS